MVLGGVDDDLQTLNDCWIMNLSTFICKKVMYITCHIYWYQFCYNSNNYILLTETYSFCTNNIRMMCSSYITYCLYVNLFNSSDKSS